MSFSRTFRGAPLAILAAIAAFPAAQRATDESWAGNSPGVTNGHAKQIELAETELNPVLRNAPTDVEHEVQIWGHAGPDGSGSVGWSVRRIDAQTPATEPVADEGDGG